MSQRCDKWVYLSQTCDKWAHLSQKCDKQVYLSQRYHNDDDASMSLNCRMSESMELLAQIECQFKMMKSLQDAECQDP